MEENAHSDNNLSWQADEFYYHQKSMSWYLTALLSSVLIASVPWTVSGGDDYITSGIILISLIGLTIYASRKPQKKHFELSNTKLKINSESFDLLLFSRYWVEVFETHTQITLIGVRRTTLPISLNLKDKELTKKVLNILQTALPQTNPSNNPVDWLMRKVKF
ncbi:MAG: hypothetical protein H6799_02030 [Candidatus Nomurabacteria bacterium]|nr:MAG: hypothetical protein H6799_02030 [Candidatus Nomurabacteria bacterium]HRV76059.1 hypothetical protein [Candidatus Saccharimonadales bacterium]